MSQQPKAKMNIPMCAACVLLCLTLFSMHLTGGLYAKYTAKGNGEDDARVAKFNVVTTGDADAVAVSTAVISDTYVITVENNSEVAVEYNMSVALESKSESAGVNASLDKDNGTLAANASTANTHTLTFSVLNWDTITENTKAESANINIGFTVTIDVVQID